MNLEQVRFELYSPILWDHLFGGAEVWLELA